MAVRIFAQEFQPWNALQAHQENLPRGSYGATAVFVGTMRDINESVAVSSMTLEHYPGMTEKVLTELAEQAIEEHALLDVLICHRVGSIRPDDPIVLVAAWSAHRKEALVACREIMEVLKTRAPFWKQENTADGLRWVTRNTPG